jgi:hypothetical protein
VSEQEQKETEQEEVRIITESDAYGNDCPNGSCCDV